MLWRADAEERAQWTGPGPGRLGGRRCAGDDGVTAVWVALLLVVVLMFAALAIDGGQAYQSGRQSQNAADAGAMAGVRVVDGIRWENRTNYADIRTQIRLLAQRSGADTTSNGVRCWIVTFPDTAGNTTRVSPGSETDNQDMCSTVYPDASIAAWVANASTGGVEVRTDVTKTTFFAGVAGHKQTEANRAAKAMSYAFDGGTGSPFVVCGVRTSGTQGLSWSYDMLASSTDASPYHLWGTKSTDTKNAMKFVATDGVATAWLGNYKYYTIQEAQVPSCGNDSSTFKGKGDGRKIGPMPTYEGVTTGNGFENQISIQVAGIKSCEPGDTVFEGCALLIPIAEFGGGTGSSSYDANGNVRKCTGPGATGTCDSGYGTYEKVVAWTAWQVYGNGSGSFDYSNYSDDKGINLGQNGGAGKPDGWNCRNSIRPGGGGAPQYCGRLLGAVVLTGGNRGGQVTIGAPRILGLAA